MSTVPCSYSIRQFLDVERVRDDDSPRDNLPFSFTIGDLWPQFPILCPSEPPVGVKQGSMRIYVHCECGEIMPLDVEPTDRIIDVKAKFPSFDSYRLFFGFTYLEDDRTLRDYSIAADAWLLRFRRFKEPSPPRIADASSIALFVRSPGPRELLITAKRNGLVEDVKSQFHAKTGISRDEQFLFYRDALLQNGNTLDSYNIRDWSELFVEHRNLSGKVAFHEMDILVRTRTRKQFPVRVNPKGRIQDLKGQIEGKEGIPSSEQRLLRGQRLLEDEHTFFYYEIKNHDMISLIQPGSGEMMIYVTFNGMMITVRVNRTDQVDYLKALVRCETGVPLHSAEFTRMGRILENGCTLGHYYIRERTVIDVYMCVRG
jgi:ubiquitin C